ncbi:MAG: phage holin family protein [Oscillospiraceae bacterium]|nr:phage holin family protein [Oscillospiraceae bacterium]
MATLSALIGSLAIPVLILVILNIIDYITGIVAAPYRGEERNSNKGFRGIAKKISMWLLIVVGGIVDWLIIYAGEAVGISVSLKFAVASAVAIWLICNEIISLLENISDIGVPLPAFLNKIVSWIKAETENKADLQDNERIEK